MYCRTCQHFVSHVDEDGAPMTYCSLVFPKFVSAPHPDDSEGRRVDADDYCDFHDDVYGGS